MSTEQVTLLDSIDSSFSSLAMQINDIIDFSRTDSTSLYIAKQQIDLESLLVKIMRKYQSIAQNKGLDFRINWQIYISPNFIVDAPRVEQVIGALMDNAIKYTECGGIDISIVLKSTSLSFTLTDTGVGMSGEQLAQIYEPFRHIEQKQYYSGAKLGMGLVKKLINAMDGNINVTSEPNKGTCVNVMLPVERCNYIANHSKNCWHDYSHNPYFQSMLTSLEIDFTEKTLNTHVNKLELTENSIFNINDLINNFGNDWQTKVLSSNKALILLSQGEQLSISASNCFIVPISPLYPDSLRQAFINSYNEKSAVKGSDKSHSYQLSGSVLIADDNKTNQLLLEKQCQRMGINVVITDDGISALTKLKSQHFDLVLTDCNMPKMDGFELTNAIKSCNELSHLPVIGLTADNSKQLSDKLISAGMEKVLTKPYTFEQLYQVFNNYLNNTNKPVKKTDAVTAQLTIAKKQHWIEVFGSEADAVSLANVFVKSATNDILEIENSLRSGEFDQLLGHLHRLKGSIVMLQHKTLSDKTSLLEKKLETQPSKYIIELKSFIDDIKCDIKEISVWAKYKND